MNFRHVSESQHRCALIYSQSVDMPASSTQLMVNSMLSANTPCAFVLTASQFSEPPSVLGALHVALLSLQEVFSCTCSYTCLPSGYVSNLSSNFLCTHSNLSHFYNSFLINMPLQVLINSVFPVLCLLNNIYHLDIKTQWTGDT